VALLNHLNEPTRPSKGYEGLVAQAQIEGLVDAIHALVDGLQCEVLLVIKAG
jgi:hypothetical protein